MKKIKIALFAITATLFIGCDDAIDIKQPSELTPERTYETVADMQLGLNGVYGAVPGENMIIFTSIFTDEVAIGKSNGGQGLGGELAFLLNANSGDASAIWISNYYMINIANRLIEGAEFVEVDEESDEAVTKNDILAQAYALRAYGHLQLLAAFSTDMKNDSAPGVIAVDFVPTPVQFLPRNTTGEVWDLIESDLDFAEENLQPIAITNRKYVSHNFIKAFRARMAAYRGQYEVAKTYVDELDAVYGLTNKTAYPAIWQDIDTGSANTDGAGGLPGVGGSEVIFALERTVSGQTGNFYQAWASINATITGSPFFEVNRALFNLVNNGLDVRRFVIAHPTSTIVENYQDVSEEEYVNDDVLPVGKYPGSEGQNLLNDIKVFRFSEMVLIRAEYYASISDLQGVANEINAIRNARYGAAGSGNIPVPATVQEAWGAIMDERRAELAFEGHRYIDIRRLGQLAGKGVERDPRDCAFNGFCTLPATDYRFTLPIPQEEIAANPGIQQNDGY